MNPLRGGGRRGGRFGGWKPGGRLDSAGAEVAGKKGGQGALGEAQSATDPARVLRGQDAEATLQATESEDRLQAPADSRGPITTTPTASDEVRSGHTRDTLDPDNKSAGQSARTGDNDSSMSEESHCRLSGLGKRLRHLFVDWCVEYEAWTCLSHFPRPRLDRQTRCGRATGTQRVTRYQIVQRQGLLPNNK
jgi:hypothetical protein